MRRCRLPARRVTVPAQRQRAANRDWNRSCKDAGPCGGTASGERSPVFSGLSSPSAGSEGLRCGGGCGYRQTGPPGGCRDPWVALPVRCRRCSRWVTPAEGAEAPGPLTGGARRGRCCRGPAEPELQQNEYRLRPGPQPAWQAQPAPGQMFPSVVRKKSGVGTC